MNHFFSTKNNFCVKFLIKIKRVCRFFLIFATEISRYLINEKYIYCWPMRHRVG